MRNNVEAIVRKMIKLNNHKINISFPAVVVNTDKLSDGFIDVKPVVNHMNSLTGETLEYPVIRGVSVIFPSSKNSTICFPLVQGDTVDLVFQSVDIEDFVNGNTNQHDPFTTGYGNMANVVAYVGFAPYKESCFNSENYKNGLEIDSLNIIHNKNTDKEVSISLNPEGEVLIKTPSKVRVEAKQVDVLAERVEANNSVINTGGDVVISGRSVKQFMTAYDAHTHTGNQGAPTSPPLGA